MTNGLVYALSPALQSSFFWWVNFYFSELKTSRLDLNVLVEKLTPTPPDTLSGV